MGGDTSDITAKGNKFNGGVKVAKTAFLFPGQGSQTPGMATALASESKSARDILAEVDDILDFNLSGLMAEGPADELNLPRMPSLPYLQAHWLHCGQLSR